MAKETDRMKPKPPRVECAAREQITFLLPMETLLLRLLRHPEAFVSDETSLWDFCSEDADRAKRPGRRPHWYWFERKWRNGASLEDLTSENEWKTTTYEARAIPFRKMLTRKILRHTGVDIGPVFNERLPTILHYIAANLPEAKRACFRGRRSGVQIL